ncbi:MAG: prolyl oligopeptidase family serine peptidase [Zavarzinella sp.]
MLDSIITKKNRDVSFAKARNDFPTKVSGSRSGYFDPPIPPKGVLELVQYPTVLGNMDAYITPKPAKHGRYPAVIWLSDHFENSIDSKLWDEKLSHVNGTVFRDAGFVVFYPSLRGGNKNPGSNENAYGEVNDVQAACIYLKNREEVDPNQIFLVGHGTGGTLALLTAAYRSDGFRGVLAFGPVARMDYYHSSELNYNIMDRDETLLRSPLYWINDITCKTWVVEGRNSPLSNELSRIHENNYLARHVSFNLIYNFDHDTIVEPTSKVYIQKIKTLKESTDKITIDPNDDIKVMQQMRK